MLIKICGFKDPETAFFAAKNGADFVGMVLTPGYERSVTVEEAKLIARAVKEGGSVPVAAFVTEAACDVERICAEIGVTTVQHYKAALELSVHLHRFYVNQPLTALRTGDYLLMENKPNLIPGAFVRPDEKPFFIAGGLTPANVQEMIAQFQPSGVDVSSGVEKGGRKNKELILEFIEKARSYVYI